MSDSPMMDERRVMAQRKAIGAMLKRVKQQRKISTYALRRSVQRTGALPNSDSILGMLSGEREYSITSLLAVLDRLDLEVRFFHRSSGAEATTPRS